jgi:glycosyltransferase involved in cell wall biosynthesis
LRAYDAFAVPNEEGAAFIRAEVGSVAKIFLLPNTVENELFVQSSVADRISLRDKLGVSPSTILLVSVARLAEPKGIRELIDGYLQLPGEVRTRTTLALVGDGPLRTEVESRARGLTEGEIRVVGHLERFGVRDWLCAADAFVLPTKRDNNPLSVIEAAFARLPLIVSRQAGNINELVQGGINGLVLEAVDAASISKALQHLLSLGDSERLEMGRRSLAIANRNFRRDDVAQRFAQQLVAVGKLRPQHTSDVSLSASVDS